MVGTGVGRRLCIAVIAILLADNGLSMASSVDVDDNAHPTFPVCSLDFCQKHVVPLSYSCEEYKVQTDDGYILVLHHISPSYFTTRFQGPGPSKDKQEPPSFSPQSVEPPFVAMSKRRALDPQMTMVKANNRKLMQSSRGSAITHRQKKYPDQRGGSGYDGHNMATARISDPRLTDKYRDNFKQRSNAFHELNFLEFGTQIYLHDHVNSMESSRSWQSNLFGRTETMGKFIPDRTPSPQALLTAEINSNPFSPRTNQYPKSDLIHSGDATSSVTETSPDPRSSTTLDASHDTGVFARRPAAGRLLRMSDSVISSSAVTAPVERSNIEGPSNSMVPLSGQTISPGTTDRTQETVPWSEPVVRASIRSSAVFSPEESARSGISSPGAPPSSSAPFSAAGTTMTFGSPASAPSETQDTFNPVFSIPVSASPAWPPNSSPLSSDTKGDTTLSGPAGSIPSPSPGRPGNKPTDTEHCFRDCKRDPVLLMHPEFVNGDIWFVHADSSTDQILPSMLVNAGYDVWIGHHRATLWGHDHVDLDSTEPGYWDWTWDEQAQYDIPAFLGFINGRTHKTVHYVGLSQSATAGAAASTRPDVAKLLRSLTLVGPTIYRGNSNSLVLDAWSVLFGNTIDEKPYRRGPWHGLFNYSLKFPSDAIFMQGPISIALATISGPNCCLGSKVISFNNGWDGTTSLKNLLHFQQGVRRNSWHHFDYGDDEENIEAYGGKPSPPSYNPAHIPATLPIFVVYGEQDMAAPIHGVRKFLGLLQGQPDTLFLPKYSHFDLVFSANRTRAIYRPVLGFLNH